MTDFISICGKNVLNELSVSLLNFNSDDWLVVVLAGAVNLFVVLSVLVVQRLKSETNELEKGFQVVWGWSCDEDVTEAKSDGSCNTKSDGC